MTESIIPEQGEHLTTGWEPDTPATDTLIRQAVLLHASWSVAVAGALGRAARRSHRWVGGHIGDHGALTNPVVLTRPVLDDETAAQVVAEVAELIPAGVSYFLLSAFPTPDLGRHGLVLLGHPPVMVRFPGGAAPALREGVELREATDAAGLAVAERVLVEGFPMPELQPFTAGRLLAPQLLAGPTRVWTAFVDGEPAATAAAHVDGGAVLVEYVATLDRARGRGAGAAVTWAAALCEPALPAMLVSSDDGRPLYEAMGFLAIERWTAWLRPAG